MIVVLLIAGIGFVLTGLLAVAYGIPVKEFSFGNTLILAGAVMACTGSDLDRALRGRSRAEDLREHLRWLPAMPRAGAAPRDGAAAMPERSGSGDDGFAFSRIRCAECGRRRIRTVAIAATLAGNRGTRERCARGAAAAARRSRTLPPKPRRNLLFSSTSRKERERAAGAAEPAIPRGPRRAPPGRTERAAASGFRRRLAASRNAPEATDAAAAAQQPRAIDLCRPKCGAGRAIRAAGVSEPAA